MQPHLLSGGVRQRADHPDRHEEVLLQVAHQHVPGQPRHRGPPPHHGLPPSQGEHIRNLFVRRTDCTKVGLNPINMPENNLHIKEQLPRQRSARPDPPHPLSQCYACWTTDGLMF